MSTNIAPDSQASATIQGDPATNTGRSEREEQPHPMLSEGREDTRMARREAIRTAKRRAQSKSAEAYAWLEAPAWLNFSVLLKVDPSLRGREYTLREGLFYVLCRGPQLSEAKANLARELKWDTGRVSNLLAHTFQKVSGHSGNQSAKYKI